MAKSSRLKALYRVSAGCSFLEKNARGTQMSFWHCCRTPPTATSEASTWRRVGADSCGKTRRVASARAAFASEKACRATSDQVILVDSPLLLPFSKAVRGVRSLAADGINLCNCHALEIHRG